VTIDPFRRHGRRLPRALRLAGLVFVLGALATPVAAAGQEPQFAHTAVIDRLWREIGGVRNVAQAQPGQLSQLSGQLMERGQLFLDLYELQRVVGRDYALMRDSIGKRGGVAMPAAQFLLARSLHELGQAAPAGRAYQQAAAPPTPPAVRSLATAWNSSLGTDRGARWQQQLRDWRQGRAVGVPTCPDEADTTCVMFRSLIAQDPIAVLTAHRALMARPRPFHAQVLQSPEGPVRIELHDPLPLFLLATADFAVAAHIFEQARQVTAGPEVRGFVLLRAGRLTEAKSFLDRPGSAGSGAAAVYLAEVQHRQGDRSGAETLWRRVAGSDPRMELAVLDARSAFGADREAVLRRFRVEERQGLHRLRAHPDGVWLARALLRHDLADEALRVLDAVRPASFGSDLNRVRPQLLVLHAHARYLAGREYHGLARGDIAFVATAFPVAGPLLGMLQEITAPSNISGVRSGE
jgi:hypothetical protein